MIKKGLLILLLLCFGLKNISLACQPFAQISSTANKANSNEANLLEFFVLYLTGTETQDDDCCCQMINDEIQFFQSSHTSICKAAIDSCQETTSKPQILTVIAKPLPALLNISLSTAHSFIFRLTPF